MSAPPAADDIGAALEAGRIGVWDWDLAGGRMQATPQMLRNLGLREDESGELYARFVAAIHPADRERFAAAFSGFRTRPGPVRIEARLAWPGDEPRWIVFLGHTVAGADGAAIRMHGITIDSTRRRAAEEAGAAALSDSERRLRELNRRLRELADRRHRQLGASRAQMQAILDSSPDWLTLFRAAPDGSFVYADLNRATELGYGLRYDQVIGRSLEEVLGEEPARLPLRLMRECIRTGRNQRYTARRSLAGVTRSIDVLLVRVPEQIGGDWHIMATARDVTERDDAEERLRRERLLFELIIEGTSEGIVVVDKELRHLVWNAAMENINGRPRGAVLGKTVFQVFPEFRDHPIGDAWRAALSGRHAEMRDYRLASPLRGGEFICDADFTPLYDRLGAIVGAVCIVHETTERHRLEHLAKLETVAQLTGGVAHDFNNLLTATMGSVELIERQAQSERVAALAKSAQRSIQRGAQLTQQLLAFARRQALQPVAADMNALLCEIEVLIRRAAGETVEVTLDLAPGLPRCVVDPAQFEAAVMNLAINARDAMPAGGHLRLATRLSASDDLPPPGAELPRGDRVALAVQDDGDGMPPEVAARAIEPFYTTKPVGKGSGLGLSMVYGFARQSGGELHIDSAVGAGTCVTLYLPAAAEQPGEPAPDHPALPETGSGSILVVEDDDAVREILVGLLQELGYRTLVAANGQDALAMLCSEDGIDLLFTDLVMPGSLSGVTLARKAKAIRPGLPVLLMTGYAGTEAPEADEFPVIVKPFRSAELSRALARALASPG